MKITPEFALDPVRCTQMVAGDPVKPEKLRQDLELIYGPSAMDIRPWSDPSEYPSVSYGFNSLNDFPNGPEFEMKLIALRNGEGWVSFADVTNSGIAWAALQMYRTKQIHLPPYKRILSGLWLTDVNSTFIDLVLRQETLVNIEPMIFGSETLSANIKNPDNKPLPGILQDAVRLCTEIGIEQGTASAALGHVVNMESVERFSELWAVADAKTDGVRAARALLESAAPSAR